MKILPKKLFFVFSLLSTASLAFSFETGGLFTNDTKFANVEKDGGLKLDQKNGLNLWARQPFNEDGTSYFSAEGSFQTEYDASQSDSDEKFKLYADINLFKFVFQKELDSGNLILSLGRFYNSDLSETVYTQNGDGAKVEFSVSKISFSAFGAYTGLLNAKNITILDNDAPELKAKTPYTLANKYVVGGVTFALPHIFASQTVALEGFAAFGLEDTTYNRFYGTLALNGPIVSPVFYSVSTTFGFAKIEDGDTGDTENLKGNLTKISISAYPDFKSMSVSLNGVYASGAQGSLDAFTGFTSGAAANSLDEPEYSGILKGGLSATIKPISNVLVSLSGDIVFDAAAGDKQDEIKAAGFQYSLGANWQIVSDVSLGLNFGQFIGTDDYSDASTRVGGNKTELKISAAIAF
ncbi:MAG: hypothetical protein IJ158_01500 [Treponema sp.]|nr:hypothetical protein [Treponema sp.]